MTSLDFGRGRTLRRGCCGIGVAHRGACLCPLHPAVDDLQGLGHVGRAANLGLPGDSPGRFHVVLLGRRLDATALVQVVGSDGVGHAGVLPLHLADHGIDRPALHARLSECGLDHPPIAHGIDRVRFELLLGLLVGVAVLLIQLAVLVVHLLDQLPRLPCLGRTRITDLVSLVLLGRSRSRHPDHSHDAHTNGYWFTHRRSSV
ncbi:hypothetical protein 10RS306A_gene4608 [Ralstonia phage 10RS306A]|uniref:Uncharacterized protein n=1 Tax=Ralstonia phage 10RS306A TaxID=2968818 RepID=A0A977TFL8_9CAUD|nr:hypothetical protein 10RS306A_gene4608 [Ralstonia phage 10RS306A]